MKESKPVKIDYLIDLEGKSVEYVKSALRFLGFKFEMTDEDITSFVKKEDDELEIIFNTINNKAVNISAVLWKEIA